MRDFSKKNKHEQAGLFYGLILRAQEAYPVDTI